MKHPSKETDATQGICTENDDGRVIKVYFFIKHFLPSLVQVDYLFNLVFLIINLVRLVLA